MTVGEPAASQSLPRESLDLLVEFSTALHKHAMYPPGHPALDRVSAQVVTRAGRLLDDRDQVAVGVARRQLIIDGAWTDPAHPITVRLAETLHDHQLAAITFLKGLDPLEVTEALRLLATSTDLGRPLGLRPAAELPAWRTIRLHPLRFDQLSLADSDADGLARTGGDLWLALAQAALEGREATAVEAARADPAVIAGALDAIDDASARDHLLVGHLLRIVRALQGDAARDQEALRARTSGLIRALRPATLHRLIRISGGEGARAGFVRDAVQGLDVAAVLEILSAAAAVAGESISDGLTRMLTKLAAQAAAPGPRRAVADEALRGQVMRLLIDWRLEDPNPDLYSRLLTELSGESQRDAAEPAVADVDTSLRVVEMALEIGEWGAGADRAFTAAAAAGHVGALVDAVAGAPDPSSPAAVAGRRRLVDPGLLAVWLAEDTVDAERLDRIQPWMTEGSYEVMLDQLIRSTNRATRRRLLDHLVAAPCDLTAAIVARLEGTPWYGLRNLLHLLAQRPGSLAGFPVARWQAHDDWRVRLEALRVGLATPAGRDGAARRALDDTEPRVVAAALRALGSTCPASLVPTVAALAADPSRPSDTRVLAVRALEVSAHPQALPALVALVDGGRTLFGRARLAEPNAVRLAALQALARAFGSADLARPFLALARASRNESVRGAVTTP